MGVIKMLSQTSELTSADDKIETAECTEIPASTKKPQIPRSKIPQSSVQFNSSDKRITIKTLDVPRDHIGTLRTPGPGTYGHDVEGNRQACNKWPRMFDRPVERELQTEIVPKPLRTEMTNDLDFKRHRNKLEYLSMYY